MNLGRHSETSRTNSRRFAAATSAENVEFLRVRLERLIKGLRIFANYCELASKQVPTKVKQFVELAEIELTEALKGLQFSENTPAVTPGTDLENNLSLPSEESWPKKELLKNQNSADTSGVVEVVPQSESVLRPGELSPLAVSFESMAQMADVPEANDLAAILARLQSCGESPENPEIENRKVSGQGGHEARELLLGFDVCRMERNTADQPNEQPAGNPVTQPEIDWPADATFVVSSDATSLTTNFERIVQSVSELTSTLSSTSPITTESERQAPSKADQSRKVVAELVDGQADEELGVPADVEQMGNSGQQVTAHPAREPKSEQTENTNPVNSISPDNLLQINALKEELSALLPHFKSTVAVSRKT